MKHGKPLRLDSSPHVIEGMSVEMIMRHVVYALLPVAAFAAYLFGLATLLVMVTAVAACWLSEHGLCRFDRRASTVNDWSVVITGLVYALTLPPHLPLWMVALGGFFGVAFGKFIFGGLGCNPFNPALVARAFLQAAFPVPMTTWLEPFTAERFSQLPASTLAWPFASPHYDSISAATPLNAWKFDAQATPWQDLLLGFSGGSAGETCAWLIFFCGLYLIVRNMMNWRIPAGIFTAVLLFSGLLHWWNPQYPTPQFMLFSGGLMLGAMFMATDMVASPLTHWGCFVYGLLIGILVMVIRVWGGLPEGVMYAILLANAVSPHIDTWLQPRPFGSGQNPGKQAAVAKNKDSGDE